MLIRNVVCEAPKFKLHSVIVEKTDPMGAHSQSLEKVLLINYIHTFYHYLIQELGTLELNQAYEAMCMDGNLKLEHKHLEVKGLTYVLCMPKNFQIKWIRFVLS